MAVTRYYHATILAGLLCATAGCSSTTSAQLTRCQTEKKQLLTRVVDEQKRAETLQAELRNVNVRLAEAEKQLARVYDARGGRFASSSSLGGTNGGSSSPSSASFGSPFSNASGSSGSSGQGYSGQGSSGQGSSGQGSAGQGAPAVLGPAGTRFSEPATVAPFVTSGASTGSSGSSRSSAPPSSSFQSEPRQSGSTSGLSQPNRLSAPRELRPQSGRMLDSGSIDMAAPRNGRTESGWMPKSE